MRTRRPAFSTPATPPLPEGTCPHAKSEIPCRQTPCPRQARPHDESTGCPIVSTLHDIARKKARGEGVRTPDPQLAGEQIIGGLSGYYLALLRDGARHLAA